MLYYNPKTRPEAKRTVLSQVRVIYPSNTHYTQYGTIAASTRQKALERNCTGHVYFYEGGILYEALSIGSFEFMPLETEPVIVADGGWRNVYFLTEEKAFKFVGVCNRYNDGVQYNRELDVYRVRCQ